MKNGHDALWTIDELSERVAVALGQGDYGGVSSGRVRDVPDSRTIRYYTTLGILDRPAAMRGRIALYGRRHLLQLVAIKRLQAQGLSLAQVQERVLGLSNAALRRLDAALSVEGTGAESAPPDSSPRAESFWRLSGSPDEEPASSSVASWQRVVLDGGVELSMEATRELDHDEVRVIQMAAAPLVEILRLRGLIGDGPAEPRK
jgi:DNA-binding transcriptional MerR regulator